MNGLSLHCSNLVHNGKALLEVTLTAEQLLAEAKCTQ